MLRISASLETLVILLLLHLAKRLRFRLEALGKMQH
jgi:hypothetical protein